MSGNIQYSCKPSRLKCMSEKTCTGKSKYVKISKNGISDTVKKCQESATEISIESKTNNRNVSITYFYTTINILLT